MRYETTFSACSKTCRSTAVRSDANRRSHWRAIWRADAAFRLSVGGRDRSGERKELLRILRFIVDENFIMHMRAGATSGAPEKPDLLMAVDSLSHRHNVSMQMSVESDDPIAVADFNDLAKIRPVAGIGHHARSSGIHRRHVGSRQIDPGMKRQPMIERIAARPKPALELVLVEWRR